MRRLLTVLLSAVAFAPPVSALGDLASFERIQSECVNVGGITFGEQGRWDACQVSKGRWFSTIGHIDFYQAQYCLGDGSPDCTQRALLLFANRAYTPVAKMVLGRLDPGDTHYSDPLVIDTALGKILTLEAQRPGHPPQYRYYLWQADGWQAIDTEAWRQSLTKRLPAGVLEDGEMRPDFATMNLHAKLVRTSDGASGTAEIELALIKTRLVVKSVRVVWPIAR